MLGLSHEHHGPGGVRGRRPRSGRRARSRRRHRTRLRDAAFRKLQLAAHWADLHPATADTGVETFGGAALLADESLGGDGTPVVAAFTPEPFAFALGMSPVGRGTADRRRPRPAPPPPDALEARLRLEVPAWQARRVARQTHRLSKAAAIWVDEQLADRGSCGPVVVDRLVAQAIAAYDPETHEDRENDAQAGWDVTLTHPEATDFLGTSHLDATGDTLVLKQFYDHVCGIAHQLFLDGDTSPLGVRKVKAIGILTGHRRHPAARGSRRTSGSTPATSNPTPSPPARSRSSAPPPSPRSGPGSATTRW